MKADVDTTIILPLENSEEFRERCKEAGIACVAMPISRITKEWRVALRYVFFSFYEIVRITRHLKTGNYDLVHVSGGSWQYKGVIAGKLAGIRVVWHLNDTSLPGIFRQIFSFLSHLSNGFIFASQRSRQYYGSKLRIVKPSFVIPAPVDTVRFDPTNSYSDDQNIISKWNEKFVIGTVANINPVKGLDVFIRAANHLKNKSGKYQFVVIGPVYKNQRHYFNTLQKLCEELGLQNVEFVGGRSDVRSLLMRFDAYVCSSYAESSPLSVWEAMSMGKPIVSTDVGDVPIYVQDGQSGFIVNVGDYNAIAERLHRFFTEKGLGIKFGERARQIAIKELDVTKCAQRHLEAYKAVLKSG